MAEDRPDWERKLAIFLSLGKEDLGRKRLAQLACVGVAGEDGEWPGRVSGRG